MIIRMENSSHRLFYHVINYFNLRIFVYVLFSNAEAFSSSDRTRPISLSTMVFSQPNPALVARERSEAIMAAAAEAAERGEAEITVGMVRRILFPQCNPEFGGQGSLELLPAPDPKDLIKFNDFTFFQLKPWDPEYAATKHEKHEVPLNPMYYPKWDHKELRFGAPEELSIRPPADTKVAVDEISKWIINDLSSEPDIIKKLRASAMPTPPPSTGPVYDGLTSPLVKTSPGEASALLLAKSDEKAPCDPVDNTAAIVDAMPTWLSSGEDVWSAEDVNFLYPRSGLRIFGQLPRRSELDTDWILRPDSETLAYERDGSLRST